ncbi:MAG: hypothetical protein IJT81_05500 [Lachnospiraceae bacterium]|nr:hypothetical protein [Lachnospiraceae bacterium]
MKKIIAVILVGLTVFAFATYAKSGETEEVDVLDLIKMSTSARVELPTGASAVVKNDIYDLRTFGDLMICKAEVVPEDTDNDWCYRITFNQPEESEYAEPIVVCIHKNYIKIGNDYYVAEEGMPYKGIYEWTKKKCNSFLKWQVD